jgi:hypothetical protein
MLVFALLIVTGTVWWIRKRDEWRARISQFMEAGRAAGRSA